MRTRFAGAGVLVLLLAACDGMCGPLPATPAAGVQHGVACVDVKAPHHAYVVVQHASGAWIQRCVGFAPGFIDAPTAMERAGIAFTTQPDEAHTTCPIDGEPAEAKRCAPGGGQQWAMFITVGGRWSLGRQSLAQVRLTDGQVLGWRYVVAADAAPSPPPRPDAV